MTRARESIINLESTTYYHCISRCVRRAFLWGEDVFSGKNYEHRRSWVINRLAILAKAYAIEVASYAVMSNHYHLVLRVDVDKAEGWSESAVIQNWSKLYKVPLVVQQYLNNPQAEGIAQVARVEIEKLRFRLMDISWFMRGLNEYLARKANQEDDCKGRFWEGRFKSQPLLDEAAVITAMSYVDLNPIRAKAAKTIEQSDYTSIQQRIKQALSINQPSCVPLMQLAQAKEKHRHALSFNSDDYLHLIDWLGRAILPQKRGYIAEELPPTLLRLNLKANEFVELMKKKDDLSGLTAVGSPNILVRYAENIGKKHLRGQALARKLYT
jgi:hypothetical protein